MVIEGGSGPNRRGGKRPPRRGPRVEQPQTVLRLPEDPYAADYPRRAKRGRGMLTIAAITVLVAAIIAITTSNEKPAGQPSTAGVGNSAGVGGGVPAAPGTQAASSQTSTGTGDPAQTFDPSQFTQSSLHGVLVGYPDTQAGAESAAANYDVAYNSEDMISLVTRHTMIQAISDPAITKTLQSQLDAGMTIVATGLGLDSQGNPPKGTSVIARGLPAGVKVVSYDKNRAVIAIWANSILGLSGAGSTHPVVEDWGTITLTLTWVNNDWKWYSFIGVEGPSPVSSQQASSSDDIQKALSQFKGLRYAP